MISSKVIEALELVLKICNTPLSLGLAVMIFIYVMLPSFSEHMIGPVTHQMGSLVSVAPDLRTDVRDVKGTLVQINGKNIETNNRMNKEQLTLLKEIKDQCQKDS